MVNAIVERALSPSAAASILAEACGNPFLLVELSRLHLEEGLEHPTVGEVARRRLMLVDADETPLLELAAVAPSPIDADLLRAALGADSRRMQLESSGLRRLCGLKILREAGSRSASLLPLRDSERYDFYHHRIREAIRDKIPPARQRRLHLRLADTFAALRPDDPESLVRELRLGGDEVRAAQHAERAAEAAIAKLAHARAAELYRLALSYAVGSDALRLRIRLGEVLEAMARFAEASEHYRKALVEPDLIGLERTRVETQQANCLMHTGELERSGRLVEEVLASLGHRPHRARLLKIFSVLWLALRVFFGGPLRRRRRRDDDLPTRVKLNAYALAVPHYQFVGRNLEQLEFALRFRLLGARSPSADVRQEAEAMALILLLPVAHLGRFARRRVRAHFRRLEAGGIDLSGDRARAWLPLLRALYNMVSGRPDRAHNHIDAHQRGRRARSGYVALQRHNALMLAGEHDRFLSDLSPEVAGDSPRPLDIVRHAYIERIRGHRDKARRLIANLRVTPDDVPWTHRSLFTYQLVELHLLDGDAPEAVRLARTLLDRIRKGAVSPTTGAFESADAVARAYVAEARRLQDGGIHLKEAAPLVAERCFEGARSLLEHAEFALSRMPSFAPPLFAPRLLHDRAVVALARGRRSEALRLFARAEEQSRDSVIPCFRLRLLEDFLLLLAADHPQRALYIAEADHLARHYRFERSPAGGLVVGRARARSRRSPAQPRRLDLPAAHWMSMEPNHSFWVPSLVEVSMKMGSGPAPLAVVSEWKSMRMVWPACPTPLAGSAVTPVPMGPSTVHLMGPTAPMANGSTLMTNAHARGGAERNGEVGRIERHVEIRRRRRRHARIGVLHGRDLLRVEPLHIVGLLHVRRAGVGAGQRRHDLDVEEDAEIGNLAEGVRGIVLVDPAL